MILLHMLVPDFMCSEISDNNAARNSVFTSGTNKMQGLC